MKPSKAAIEGAGHRLAGAVTHLMEALHVERIYGGALSIAVSDEVKDFEKALEQAHIQTSHAWGDCMSALAQWGALYASKEQR